MEDASWCGMVAGGPWYLVGCSKLVGHGIWWRMVAGGVQYLVGHGSWSSMVAGGVQ